MTTAAKNLYAIGTTYTRPDGELIQVIDYDAAIDWYHCQTITGPADDFYIEAQTLKDRLQRSDAAATKDQVTP